MSYFMTSVGRLVTLFCGGLYTQRIRGRGFVLHGQYYYVGYVRKDRHCRDRRRHRNINV